MRRLNPLTPAQLAVLVCVASYVDDVGVALQPPATDELTEAVARYVGLSRGRVCAEVDNLIDFGVLVKPAERVS